MPYSLAFGFKDVILLVVRLPTTRIEAYNDGHNDKVLAHDLNFAKEKEKMHSYGWPVIRNNSSKHTIIRSNTKNFGLVISF